MVVLTCSWISVSASVVLVAAAAIGILLRVPVPDLQWETVVVPAAQEYMVKAMGVDPSSFSSMVEDDGNTKPLQPLRGMNIAVTGATSGIGLAVTRKLSQLGATVIAIGRSPQKLQELRDEQLPGNSVETVLADFSDLDSVAAASRYILEHYDHIDILVNNAGIHTGFQGNIQTWASRQGYDLPFTVNYLSHFLLTERLLPLLQKSRNPKVVQVSSRFHWAVDGSDLSTQGGTRDPIASQKGGSHGFGGFRSQRQYGNSKMAQIIHARSLRRAYPWLQAVSVCPTWVGTQIGAKKGTLMHSLFESTAFPVDGFGLSSLLHAILDFDNDDGDDFYINSFGSASIKEADDNSVKNQIHVFLPAWTYQWLPLRDMLVGAAAFSWVYLLQRLYATRQVGRSSPPTYDQQLQEELYTWSRQAVSPWL